MWWKKSQPREFPRPQLPPKELRDGVGPGNFWEIGSRTTEQLRAYAGLRSNDRVLEIGSGLGRVAYSLMAELPFGSYAGFDVVRPYVDWCRAELSSLRRDFRFLHADVLNTEYNPGGDASANSYRFPWRRGVFDLAIAVSVFTHLESSSLANYLRETNRVLAAGGRLFATYFLLDQESLAPIRHGLTYPTFTVPVENGLLHRSDIPESAIAYDREWVLEQLTAAGFTVHNVYPGAWRRVYDVSNYQDTIVAHK